MTLEKEKTSELFKVAVGLHRNGRLLDAEQVYQKIIETCPEHADALNLLGIVAYQRGNIEIAIDSLNKAVEIEPNCLEYHNNFGNILVASGKLKEAVTCYERVIALNPNYTEAHNNLGNVLVTLGKLEEAIISYENALTINPHHPQVNKNLGETFLKLEKYEHAQKFFHQALFNQYGLTPKKSSRFDASKSNELNRLYASPFKLKDRIDQINYLLENQLIDSSFQNLVERYHSLLNELNSQVHRDPDTPLTEQQAELFAGYYDKIIYYNDAQRVSSSAVNESLDWKSIETSYKTSSVVYFDDFLSTEALEGLRKFCLESTVFFRDSVADIVGSYMSDGFVCSLLYQIIADLKKKLPSVLDGLPLKNMWVYRYASRGSGVKTHTDDASVTLNFWITPDEANLNPNGGSGLVIYDREQPFDWNWVKYNKDKNDPDIIAEINTFLESANSLMIPYRCNRAVLFHSNLFHRSDPFHFYDSFESRRMNITMLFGAQGKENRKEFDFGGH